jgi:hypothetical protein
MMAGVATPCEVCEGKRFQAAVLEHHLGDRDISEVLAMSVTEAEEFFGAGQARTPAARAVSRDWPTSAPATSASGSRSRRCPAASASG